LVFTPNFAYNDYTPTPIYVSHYFGFAESVIIAISSNNPYRLTVLAREVKRNNVRVEQRRVFSHNVGKDYTLCILIYRMYN